MGIARCRDTGAGRRRHCRQRAREPAAAGLAPRVARRGSAEVADEAAELHRGRHPATPFVRRRLAGLPRRGRRRR